MNTKAFFLCWEGSNLILGIGKENQIFILRTPAAIKFFHQILKNCHFDVKKNHYPPRWICMTHRVPTAPGKPGKMTTVFPVLEKYWNFIILLQILEKWE